MFRHQEQNLYKSFKFLPFDSDIYLPLGLGYEGHIKIPFGLELHALV